MDFSDPGFEAWLSQQEAEADRVKRRGDYRERQASDLLRCINGSNTANPCDKLRGGFGGAGNARLQDQRFEHQDHQIRTVLPSSGRWNRSPVLSCPASLRISINDHESSVT
jgi:hypothetical protein